MESAGEILKNLLDKKNSIKADRCSSLFRSWRDLVGVSPAEHSRVYDLRNKVLFVEVDHPGWMQTLHFNKNSILKQLEKNYPELEIHKISFKVNLKFSSQPDERVVATADESSRDNKYYEIDRIVSAVKDDELKKRLKNLFVGSLKRTEKKAEQ